MKSGKYAQIIIDISHENVDRPYTYLIPEALKEAVDIGTSVTVPFGAGNKLRKGIVVDITDTADFPDDKLKYIVEVSKKDLAISDYRIDLAAWMKRNYGSTMIQALKTVLPVKKKVKESVNKTIIRKATDSQLDEYIEIALRKKNVAQLRLLYELKENETILYSLVTQKLHISQSTINRLKELKLIEISEERVFRSNVAKDYGQDEALKLSEEQQAVVDALSLDLKENRHEVFLLHGITGSGKTEVYLQAVNNAVSMGKQAIVLIPEIALTFQTLMRFYKRFSNRVGVMNSTLSQGEKYDLFEQAQNGAIDVVIGPRSALFVPFKNLGLIIIDEEHEGSYKSETMPRYNARETAIEIARMTDSVVLLGSATPSIDSYYKCEKGEYRLFKLTKRLTGNDLPNVTVSDLREELKSGNRSIFSRKLQELMADRLSKGEQTMLFLNRRGFAGFVSCRACGFVVKCPHCDVSLSLHRNNKLVCHYCGYTQDNYKTCPQCNSKYILGFKAGTEQVEEAVTKMFPGVRTLRMDADTTKDKDSYENILSDFLNGKADVLIGTQMIVKGHDFKNVTLVGVLAADMSLFAQDFRAPERTFQLLTQAAGRAGRGAEKGEVVIQTYKPDHYCIQHAINQDYESFYEEEIGYRELMDYPPSAHMLCVLVSSADEAEGDKLLTALKAEIEKHLEIRILGPSKALISKINDVYRMVLYIKDSSYDKLVDCKDIMEEYLLVNKHYGSYVMFDFDPLNTI